MGKERNPHRDIINAQIRHIVSSTFAAGCGLRFRFLSKLIVNSKVKKCAECSVELYKHPGIFKNMRSAQRSTSHLRNLGEGEWTLA